MKSVKKTFAKFLNIRFSDSCIKNFISKFRNHFKAHRYDNTETAKKLCVRIVKMFKR